MERILAKIVSIDDVITHPNADTLDIAIIGGWQVVIRRGEYEKSQLAIMCEIDSWIPTELAPFLSKGKEPREYNGVKGERLRTIRLRSEFSQGLLLPLSVLPASITDQSLETDVTEILGIQKWEPMFSANLAGNAKGNFPSTIIKTDAERIQNLNRELEKYQAAGLEFEVTEKIEGTSGTFAIVGGEFTVCSRNVNLKEDETNLYWKVARDLCIEEKLRTVGEDITIQGEIFGEGIQGNIYKLKGVYFNVFTVQQNMKYWEPARRREFVNSIGLDHAPVLATNMSLSNMSIRDILAMADAKSVIGCNPLREGVVFKSTDGKVMFKAVSNEYLLKADSK